MRTGAIALFLFVSFLSLATVACQPIEPQDPPAARQATPGR